MRVFGYGGNAAAYEHSALFRFERTPNFLVANAVDHPRLAGVASDDHFAGRGVDPNLWYMITDAPADGTEIQSLLARHRKRYLNHHDEHYPALIQSANPADAPPVDAIAQVGTPEQAQKLGFHFHPWIAHLP